MKRFVPLLLALPFGAFAADVIVGTQPKAVFTPSPGGYILRQPGPSPLNLSATPQPVTPPATGIPGRGAFSGGKKFRVNGNDFEMGGEYDMPIPKTSKTVPVTAVSKFPLSTMGKSALKMLPLVGNLYMAGELLDEMAREWDAREGGPPAVADPTKGTVTKTEQQEYWEFGGKTGSSAAAVCNAYLTHTEQTESGPVVRTGTADLLDSASRVYGCRYSHLPASSGYGGYPNLVKTEPVTRPLPTYVRDTVGDSMTPEKVKDLVDEILSKPNGDTAPWSLHEDAPTIVTGPSTAPVSTTTTSSSQGTTNNTTTTNITYNDNRITVTSTTTTTITRPDGTTDTEVTDTETTETPDDPNPADTKPSDVPGLCELFPDILACKKLDEPAPETIPKEDRDISLQTGPDFSGGSCPPDVVVSVGGQQVTVLSTAQPCGWIETYMRPIILLLASISAAFIVLPRAD